MKTTIYKLAFYIGLIAILFGWGRAHAETITAQFTITIVVLPSSEELLASGQARADVSYFIMPESEAPNNNVVYARHQAPDTQGWIKVAKWKCLRSNYTWKHKRCVRMVNITY